MKCRPICGSRKIPPSGSGGRDTGARKERHNLFNPRVKHVQLATIRAKMFPFTSRISLEQIATGSPGSPGWHTQPGVSERGDANDGHPRMFCNMLGQIAAPAAHRDREPASPFVSIPIFRAMRSWGAGGGSGQRGRPLSNTRQLVGEPRESSIVSNKSSPSE